MCCHCQNQVYQFHSHDHGENFIEIDPLSLYAALRDEPSIVLDDAPVFILLGLEDPLELNRAMSWWKSIDLPHLVLN
jgi:hypothetical protein